ncbi:MULTISPECIES: roadblock/LC7 domain-containing protein [unclassified Oceanobacter]|jgi:predicted regulator of Ras-like GTPase activity (Roadblock/LC7/MglB family)|uniref:roadblock/LC7 domain-containing protein n=2 Tax=Gammaproteobacteria TaxID=1236 RepID=UPI002734982C|nr:MULTISPECIES: roadblock/LC7 domain-containing protein [unclassified Oceanobacter]MDP2507053.1 roadblock/LC7 domain-containing protein [Oceanobacter sp. 3_MG-2023]MDP2548165.1 roadblock/LC7 domain-containing protein [Oceanobacter sp. 4_MG-2023]MDP2609574.1 roadblock/LC7 domain-containing protein [Oceanobacter sp. 1_MG-2023]MDP2612965.1 roadblock/LC7 domain-containing protein [Oceanobacter sp. 2_MG-2023]
MNNPIDPLKSNTLMARCHESLLATTQQSDNLSYMILSTSDGYVISHTVPFDTTADPKRLAAMAASFAGIGSSLAAETQLEEVEGNIIESKNGFVGCHLIRTDTMDAVLLGVFNQHTTHGLALWMLKKASGDIREIMTIFSS